MVQLGLSFDLRRIVPSVTVVHLGILIHLESGKDSGHRGRDWLLLLTRTVADGGFNWTQMEMSRPWQALQNTSRIIPTLFVAEV